MNGSQSIDIHSDNAEYTVFLSPRKTARRLTLRIDAKTKKIMLTHPLRCSRKSITEFVSAQTEWIEKHIVRIPERIPFIPGAKILFEGEEYTLTNIRKSRGICVYEDTDKKIIVAECPPERFSRAIELFLKKEALEALSYCAARKAEKIGKNVKSVSVRDTKSRWGSCTSKGVISFSWRLIMAPPYVMDYLVSHEISHLMHMNHSDAFWRTCANLSQDMAGAEIWLRKFGPLLHRYDTV